MYSFPQMRQTILRVSNLNRTSLTRHSSGGENNGQQQKQSAEPEQQKQSEQ